jgi:hypothetical protein
VSVEWTHGVLLTVVVGALLTVTACSNDEESTAQACGVTTADAAMSLDAVHRRIEELGGAEAQPVVPLDLFLEGNDDEASIAPNLPAHPGMETFRCVLREIDARPEVADVVVGISEVTFEEEWPYADRVYVITSATGREVHGWARQLEPDPYDESLPDGWLDGDPPGAPPVPPGHRVVLLYWD